MPSPSRTVLPAVLLPLMLSAVLPTAALGQGHRPGNVRPRALGPLEFQERVIAGGQPGDFMTVRHVLLRGANFDIGRKLAELAATRHGYTLKPAADPRMVRVRRNYYMRYSHAQMERARGVAAYFNKSVSDDQYWFAGLPFGFEKPGCTVIYYPPDKTGDGNGVLSRNFDFMTGTFDGKAPGPDQIAVCSSPYVLELHPHQGHASLSICAFDLLGGVVDGINAQGLCVALLADEDPKLIDRRLPPVSQAGFGVLEIGRYLLDTCADVEQAKDALLEVRLTAATIPCHYLIADRFGQSFIWENDAGGQYGHIIEGGGKVQVATNFLQHLHPEELTSQTAGGESATSAPSSELCERFGRAQQRIMGHAGKFDAAAIREISRCVAAERPAPPGPEASVRTLWHAVYSPEQRALEASFYLGEEPPGSDGVVRVRRSDYVRLGFER